MNSSVYLGDQGKKSYFRPSNLLVKTKKRPATYNPTAEADKLFIASIKSELIIQSENSPPLFPIHTLTGKSRQRRKVKSVIDPVESDNPEQGAAGLIGNTQKVKAPQKTVTNFMSLNFQHNGLLMFRKYNHIIKGKKLRSHRVSTLAS